jgi:putative FmdB family regulatory protein
MPTYDFECEKCAYYTEIKQDIYAPSVHECPHCEEKSLRKIFINPPAMFVRGEPTTIRHQADRNTQNMGKYELEDKKNEHGITPDKEQISEKNTRRKINAMTPQQQMKWIKEGD